MDKLTAGLLGAVAGLATIGSAQAATAPAANPAEALHAASYAELLQPVPNAAALLRADDAARARVRWAEDDRGDVYRRYGERNEHHHHHHNNDYGYYGGQEHHHHHHHHHSNAFLRVPGAGGVAMGTRED